MTHKNKVKELVGGGLNAYHTKALQQMDRIEKKNKEQNHKISMLTNELDNDYLTKTEEGSVISLDHSKEGMVYIDSLEGNTLVNYCTDGSKELTLNGDIDLEGTFVTTTEGVDNGKVDIMCEGNTLIVDADGNEVDAGTEGATLMSVGQDDENGHKIEILSQNKNLFDGVVSSEYSHETIKFNVSSDGVLSATNKTLDDRPWAYDRSQYRMKLKKGNYTITLETVTPSTSQYSQTIIYKKGATNSLYMFGRSTMDRVGSNSCQISLNEDSDIGIESKFFDGTFRIQIEKGNQSTTFTPYKSNKKEILLNEPLRGLPNGVKDRFVKIGGKLFIERNVVCYVPDTSIATFRKTYPTTSIIDFNVDNVKNANQMSQTFYLECMSTIPYFDPSGTVWQNENAWLKYYPQTKNTVSSDNIRSTGKVSIYYDKTWSDQQIIDWCNSNDLKFLLPCETPTYEPLEINPELTCYNDTTHISNNSIIPCTMKVKNSGYNAIIKPSTLYTVVLDTNKSGTIGMNLGGAKGTTTNNVLTLTTPATLTDDSLRIYGKGIKGSKVRLLEGDKTNWIPSHFEGMKSCFEDKVQEDGTYKMEILSSNKNMFNKIDAMKPSNWLIGTYHSFKMQLKPNTRYSVSVNYRTDKPRWMGIFEKPYNYDGMLWAQVWNNGASNFYKSKFTTPKDGVCYLSVYSEPNTIEDRKQLFNEVYNDLTIQEEIFGDEPIIQNSNKIQFSSIEPLRKLDRFVLKDGELMIERNNAKKILNGTENWMYDTTSSSQEVGRFGFNNIGMKGNRSLVICDKYAFKTNYTMTSHNYEGTFTSIGGSTLYLDTLLNKLETKDLDGFKKWLSENLVEVVYELAEPTYEEIPYELQKIILEGYENGTLFIDTNIPPTITTTYAGETPIVKSVRLNKTEVLNNTNDINDNIIPYLMDMDYRVVCLQLESNVEGVSMTRLFGGTYEMLQRDILSNRYSKEEYKYRLDAYLSANKITNEEYERLGDMLNE